MEQKIMVVDSLTYLPENPYKSITEDFEKTYAVKWYAILAYVGEELAGFMHVFRNPDKVEEWYFGDVHTREKYRKRQVATRMYETAIDLVKQYDKAYCIMASVHSENVASLKLHEKFGFVDLHRKSEFCDFIFEPEETMHYYYFVSIWPAKNNEMSRSQLYPLWKRYLQDNSENKCIEAAEQAVNERLEQTEKEENLHFDRIWAGDNLIGFIYHSCNKGNMESGVFNKEDVLDFYILPEWRKNWSNLKCLQ